MNHLIELIKAFNATDFIQENKHRLITVFGTTTVGCTPSIEPTKTILLEISTQTVIDVLQIISLTISILVGITVLYRFFESLKKEKNGK